MSMQQITPLGSAVVGAGNLAIRCAELLLEQHWHISVVISADTAVLSWAKAKQIPVISLSHSGKIKGGEAPAPDTLQFDYLFVLGNITVEQRLNITPWIKQSKRGAVQCHDAYLPDYRGYNASAWALINQETSSGISWHDISHAWKDDAIITETCFEGGIWEQVSVPIAADETSLTLNAKCYEAALASFPALLQQLQNPGNQPEGLEKTTNPERSRYFSDSARPSASAILAFQQAASELSALVRGLDFGPGYTNPLGLAKLWLGGANYYAVAQLECLGQTSTTPPGTLVSWDQKGLRVATATVDIVLSGFTDCNGEAINPQALVQRHALTAGQTLPLLAKEDIQTLTQFSEHHAQSEDFWMRRLETRQPLGLPAFTTAKLNEGVDGGTDNPTETNATGLNQPDLQQTRWSLPSSLQVTSTASGQAPSDCSAETQQRWLSTAFSVFLTRLSPESYGDFDFGVPSGASAAPAHLPQTLFADAVPLRIQPDLEANFEQILQQLKTEWQQVWEKGTYALDLWLRHPALKQQLDVAAIALPIGVHWAETDDSPSPTAHWPKGRILTLVIDNNASESDAAPGITCYYDRHHLSENGMARLQAQFFAFVQGLIEYPNRPVCQQPLLPDAERQQVLLDWNQTTASYPWNCCVHELFEQQVERTPDCLALQYKRQSLTYQALNQRANQLAHYLRSQGLQPEDRVGVHLDRSLDMIVALLGVLKSGAAYIPMDPTYPAERLAWMQEDAAPKLVLTQAHLLDSVPGGAEHAVCLDSDWEQAIAPHATSNLSPVATPHNLAYIIYTSGSTGRPKGVMIEHRSLTNLSQAVIHDYEIACDIVLEFASISFDMAVEEIYPCLISGGMVVIRTAEMIQSVPDFLAECDSLGITVLSLPTAYWHLMVAELTADPNLRIPEKVRVVLIGGEAANPKRVVQWQQMCHRTGCRAQLLNTYGPTEGTVDSTAYHFELPPLASLDPENPSPVPIGYPISNVTNYVLDRYQQPVPVGALGELCVGGAGVARGYLNRPDLTAERFVSDPFSSDAEARLYRTGDLVRHRADGAIEYMGRIDNQVKIRGFRIELGEIEAVISQHPQVEEAVVIVREDRPGQKQLVAYVVPKTGETIASETLRQHLQQKLPDYMVPKAFVELATLPMTPNEKVDRKALPQPDLSALQTTSDVHTPPETTTEKQLAEIWENILGVTPVGRTDSFLALGGDSLTAMRLFMQIERVFNQKLSLSTLFQFPTVQELAQVIAGEAEDLPKTSLVPLQSQGTKPPLFFVNCSQEGNRVASYVGEDYPFYGLNIFGATDRLCEELDSQWGQLTLTQIARAFIDDMRRVQPQGPYYLSSYCGDTRLALELAHELRRQGETVALLALIDPWWNDAPPTLQYHLNNLRYFGIDYVIEKAREKVNLLRSDLSLEVERFRTKIRQRISRQAPTDKDLDIALYGAFWYASHIYQPEIYDGNIMVLLSEELRLDQTGELDDVWEAFSADYPVFKVPGYHHEIFDEPGIKVIGERLRQSIDAASKVEIAK